MGQSKNVELNAERRAYSRIFLKTAVNFTSESNFYTGFTKDISEGGIFVATHQYFQHGMLLELEFSLPDSPQPIHVKGEVCWVREYRDDSDAPPGIGLRFVDLQSNDRYRIESFINQRDSIFYDE